MEKFAKIYLVDASWHNKFAAVSKVHDLMTCKSNVQMWVFFRELVGFDP